MGKATVETEYTLDEVQKHTKTGDCWLIIGNDTNGTLRESTKRNHNLTGTGGKKVYDVSKYLDDHPGGAEVMLDVAGQDADEFFEDIGHSKEARLELAKHLIGTLKIDEKAIAAMKAAAEAKKKGSSSSGVFLVVLVAVAAVLFALYQTRS